MVTGECEVAAIANLDVEELSEYKRLRRLFFEFEASDPEFDPRRIWKLTDKGLLRWRERRRKSFESFLAKQDR
jgi:hypothetical protein